MRLKLWYICYLALSPAVTGPVAAQSSTGQSARQAEATSLSAEPRRSEERRKTKKSWRVAPSIRIDAEYDDNIFRLDSGRKDNVEDPSSAEVISGRYADMKQASDVLTTVSAGFVLKGPGMFAKPALITPEVSYERYTHNAERSNVGVGISIRQEAGAGRLRLQGRVTSKYFARNYLADAVDRDANGSITEDERVYAPGEYSKAEFAADYRLSLSKATRHHPFGVSIQMGGGFSSRSYAAPLPNRNLDGPMVGAKLLLDLGRRLELDLGYDYSSMAGASATQVLLLNEPDFDQDFNGNGTTTDLDARVATLVDRSRREHRAGATVQFELGKPLDLTLGYQYRWRQYTSSQPLDVSHRGRKDARHQVSGDIRFRLTKGLRFRAGGVHSRQDQNRSGDPGSLGEVDDYTRSQARLGLSYEL
ncbi:MAG TPA: hypothetical protein VFS51_01060 [Gemmatimonadales bacterium]|nr:hypothetical protein [Gemmatimonadales bacterium]